MSKFLAIVAVSLEILPVLSHRLITNPYPQQELDSVVVSSDPITITDKAQNKTTFNLKRPQKRSFECPENDFACLYSASDSPDDSKTHSENSRDSYWTMIGSQTHNHPFDDKTGWVTLDPVPWSTSKISKWHPNKVAIHQESKPWDYAPTTERPPQRPVQQFWVSGSSYHHQRPTSQWGIGSNDIITDSRPSGFPTEQFHGYGSPDHVDSGVYSGQQQQNYHPKGNRPNRPMSHPSTYPSNGNGEWVLLSTTKGYSLPQRQRWPPQKTHTPTERLFSSRKIKSPEISKYHEEDLETKKGSNRKSDENPAESANSTEPPVQILFTSSHKHGEPTATVRRKVRLQVLPSLESSSTSHGGLLEVDSSQQTVDEAQQEDEKLQKLKAIAKVKKGKIRGFKLVPTSKFTGKGMTDRNVMTLAAVGAGMIPATMALLVPMALGRRKRSLATENRL